jgi:hypothetical protein
VAVPLRKSIGSEIGLCRPPPLSISSAHTFTVSPSPNVLLVVEFTSWITAPKRNHNYYGKKKRQQPIPDALESTNIYV